jgi:hypothetical protein
VETGGAFWLLDEIAIIRPYIKRIAAEQVQVLKLVVCPDNMATLACEDGNYNVAFTKEIAITDVFRSMKSRSGLRTTRSVCPASTEAAHCVDGGPVKNSRTLFVSNARDVSGKPYGPGSTRWRRRRLAAPDKNSRPMRATILSRAQTVWGWRYFFRVTMVAKNSVAS